MIIVNLMENRMLKLVELRQQQKGERGVLGTDRPVRVPMYPRD